MIFCKYPNIQYEKIMQSFNFSELFKDVGKAFIAKTEAIKATYLSWLKH